MNSRPLSDRSTFDLPWWSKEALELGEDVAGADRAGRRQPAWARVLVEDVEDANRAAPRVRALLKSYDHTWFG